MVEGRLSGVGWGLATTRNAVLSDRKLMEAVATALRRSQGDHSSAALHDAALARLVAGPVNEAAELMESVARSDASKASLWSDAAALRAEAGRKSGDSREFLAALVLADRALSLDPRLPEAHFNRGLALERLGFRLSAIRAYQRANSGNDDAWQKETASRIRSLGGRTNTALWSEAKAALQTAATKNDDGAVEAIVRKFSQQSRAWAEGECLANWSDALRAGKAAEAQQLLHAAKVTGETLRKVNGESLLIDAVGTIERAEGARLSTLARAYEVYRRGRIAYSHRNNAAAAADLQQAALLFAEGDSPMENVARYFALSAAFDEGLSTTVADELRALRARVAQNHRALLAQIDWEIGTVLVNRGELNDALNSYNRSLHGFEALQETDFTVRMRTAVARTLFLMGQSAESFRIHLDSFAVVGQSGDDQLLESMLHETVTDELLDHNHDAARALTRIAIEDIKPSNRRRRFDLALWHALLSPSVDLQPVEKALALIDDSRLKADAEDYLRYGRAIAVREKDPRRAAELFGTCIRYAASSGTSLMLPYLHLERARALRGANDQAGAIEELNRAIQLFEMRRQNIEIRDFRDAYIGTINDAFEELLAIYAQRGELDAAVSLAEHRRGRIFIDSLGKNPDDAHPLSISEVAARLRPGESMLMYTEAGSKLLATTVTAGAWSTRVVPMPFAEVHALTSRILQLIAEGHDAAPHGEVARLSAALITRPPAGAPPRKIVIVTDGALRDLPFALLRRPGSSASLLEEAPIVRAPSGSAYVQASRAGRRPQTLVAVADPAFAVDAFSGFDRLPAAALEAKEVAALYPRTAAWSGEKATFSNLARAVSSADVLHIATHAVANRQDPAYSLLLLARDADDTGACSLRRVAGLTLKPGCTVVLAGCSTAVAGAGHGDLRDFANAFLAAGAGSTVATLWDVEDDAARQFSLRFHQRLRDGESPASALRAAQLAMLHSQNAPIRATRAWAAFQVYGTGE
jgi:tetratricopeptide (TPR) repeat protein